MTSHPVFRSSAGSAAPRASTNGTGTERPNNLSSPAFSERIRSFIQAFWRSVSPQARAQSGSPSGRVATFPRVEGSYENNRAANKIKTDGFECSVKLIDWNSSQKLRERQVADGQRSNLSRLRSCSESSPLAFDHTVRSLTQQIWQSFSLLARERLTRTSREIGNVPLRVVPALTPFHSFRNVCDLPGNGMLAAQMPSS